MKKDYPATREEYASFFQRIRSKESNELRSEDYTNLRTNLLAGLNEHIIGMDLVADVAELVKLPLGTTNYKKEIDKTLDMVVKNIRERGQKGPKGSKYSIPNLVAPAAPKPEVRTVKIKNLDKSWVDRQIRLYGKGLPKDGFTGIGCKKGGDLYVKGTGKYAGRLEKLEPGYLMQKRRKTFYSAWRSNILIE